ncbi:glycosyltransferase family 2 protein [Paenibacillus sp. DMB20]|uniref:glycosyltransferase family 2 protein n=1 Tax=Paenibacillus sp. DMB20 TaxID=1642570 RepID=UPI001F160467|nr:glycosyltransferase family A protein [Paenibacillus sp. DMB20]
MEQLISIVMPTYNRAQMISGAIESILSQSYVNWELIVVDDQSTDHTKEAIREWTHKDARIRYVCNEREKGPGGARNTGMLAAQGEYLAFLDSDDEWYPCHLTDSMRTLALTKADISFALWVEQHGDITSYNFDNKVERSLLHSMRTTFETWNDGETIVFKKGLFEAFLSHTRNFFSTEHDGIPPGAAGRSRLDQRTFLSGGRYDLSAPLFRHIQNCAANQTSFRLPGVSRQPLLLLRPLAA